MKLKPNQKHIIVIGATVEGLTAACDILSRDTENRYQISLLDALPFDPEAPMEEPLPSLLEQFTALGGELRFNCPIFRIDTVNELVDGRSVHRPVAVHYAKNHRTYRLSASIILSVVPLEQFEVRYETGPADPTNYSEDLRYIGEPLPEEPAPAEPVAEIPAVSDTPEASAPRADSPDFEVTEEIPIPRKYPEPIFTIGVYVNAADTTRKSYCVSIHLPFRRG